MPDHNRSLSKDEQPGLEVVVPSVDQTSSLLPETNYIENDASPPPQEFQISTLNASHFRPSSLYDTTKSAVGPGAGYTFFDHGKESIGITNTNPDQKHKHETSPYTATTSTSTWYSHPAPRPEMGSPDLEENRGGERQVHLPVQEISTAADHPHAGYGQDQGVEFMKRIPFWRRKKFWIILGAVFGVIIVVGAIAGGVLASQE